MSEPVDTAAPEDERAMLLWLAVRLDPTAEVQRIATEALSGLGGKRTVVENIRFEHALRDILRVLGAGDD
jgi:hypothetical protein